MLDIGGGGEGIIGLLKPTQVVAIDISKRELAQAPPGPLKIVMDATDLKFLDGTFSTATSFFTLMDMKPETQRRAIEEVQRVLAPGGRFLVWEVTIPAKVDPVQDVAVFPLRIRMPGREVTTGYGTFFPDRRHDAGWFAAMLGNRVRGRDRARHRWDLLSGGTEATCTHQCLLSSVLSVRAASPTRTN